MKQLSKAQLERRDELAVEIDRLTTELNCKIEEARDFATEVGEAIDEYISERSEKWQESERGEAFAAWRDEWISLDLPDADDVTAILEALPTEPE